MIMQHPLPHPNVSLEQLIHLEVGLILPEWLLDAPGDLQPAQEQHKLEDNEEREVGVEVADGRLLRFPLQVSGDDLCAEKGEGEVHVHRCVHDLPKN